MQRQESIKEEESVLAGEQADVAVERKRVPQQITAASWDRLKKKLDSLRKNNPETNYKIRMSGGSCRDVDEALPDQTWAEILDSANQALAGLVGGDSYSINLFPHFRFENTKQAWLDNPNNPLLPPFSLANVQLIEEYRKTAEWKEAEGRFDKALEDPQIKADFTQAFDKDVKSFFRRPHHEKIETDEARLRAYYRCLCIDRLSWMPKTGEQSVLGVYFTLHQADEGFKCIDKVKTYAKVMGADNTLLLPLHLYIENKKLEEDKKLEEVPVQTKAQALALEQSNNEKDAGYNIAVQMIAGSAVDIYLFNVHQGNTCEEAMRAARILMQMTIQAVRNNLKALESKKSPFALPSVVTMPRGTVLYSASNLPARGLPHQEKPKPLPGRPLSPAPGSRG